MSKKNIYILGGYVFICPATHASTLSEIFPFLPVIYMTTLEIAKVVK